MQILLCKRHSNIYTVHVLHAIAVIVQCTNLTPADMVGSLIVSAVNIITNGCSQQGITQCSASLPTINCLSDKKNDARREITCIY